MDKLPSRPPGAGEEDFAYLLVKLGFHLAGQFGERLAPLGLEPRHAGMLTRLAAPRGSPSRPSAGSSGSLRPGWSSWSTNSDNAAWLNAAAAPPTGAPTRRT